MNFSRDIIRISMTAALGLVAAAPGHTALIHHYTFNGNVDDQAGDVNGTLVGDARRPEAC